MTALGIRYLTGYSVAANVATPRLPEWPPHPGRVFMAIAATHFETRGDEREREALEWLEQAGAPAVRTGRHNPRSFVETYVRVNDRLDRQAGPGLRARQPRSFTTTRPDRDCMFLVWDSEVPQHLRDALERLCNKVTRIGHSSSLVQMWLPETTETLDVEWRPNDTEFEQQMRVAEPGTLAYLEKAFNQKAIKQYHELAEALQSAKGKERNKLKSAIAERFPEGPPRSTRPRLARWQGYVRLRGQKTEEQVQSGPFDPDLIILTKKDEQRVFGLETTLQLTSALRAAAMKAARKDVPEWLSGHQPDSTPTSKPHVAFFPLPFVGAKHADGHLMGMAVAIPRALQLQSETRDADLRRTIGALLFRDTGDEKVIHLRRSHVWDWELEREKREYPPLTLRAATWTGPAREWASVTPVVLHHYPKRNRENDVQRILVQAFESAGLPLPVEIHVHPVSLFEGAGHAQSMPQFTEGGESLCRYQVHIIVQFPVRVTGPVLVGRGRYRGYGLLRPVEVGRG
jgi:CRISPR-associated protein Csb2